MQKKIIFSDSYLESRDELNKQYRKIARKKISKFAKDEKTYGFQIHPLNKINCDESFKSARVSDDLRLIFSQKGNKYILLYIDHHDKAYEWAEGKYLNKNSFGSVYIKDENIELEEIKKDLDRQTFLNIYRNSPGVLEEKEVTLDDLKRLEIDEEIAEYLLEIKDIDTFIDFISILPEEIAEGLIEVVTGCKLIDEVYNDLIDESVPDKESVEQALNHKNSKRRFYFVDNEEELDYILKEDIEKWKLFLHPNQEEVVKMNFNGPALIEGGPGTGKTVVGMHRAVYLANEVYSDSESRILFCTFSKKLANYSKDNIKRLAEQKSAPNNIEVKGVDSEIYRLINKHNLTNKEVEMEKLNEILENIYLELNLNYDFDFYKTEYQEVIQRYKIRSLEEYLEVERLGRRCPLGPKTRKNNWKYFKKVFKLKRENNLIDFEDRAWILFNALKNGEISPIYDSVIIDEAQDLSPVKLKLLNELVKDQPNNMFLLSDKNQRIYKLDSWKNDVGLDIVGRTYYLSLNYRTTKQIRRYADNQFVENNLSDSEYLNNYKSVYVGSDPIVENFQDKKSQYEFIVNKIKGYIEHDENGIRPWEISIISPIDKKEIGGVLTFNNISYSYLKGDIYPKPDTGVSISSLHGCKGLEFKIVFLVNYSKIEELLINSISDKWFNQRKKLQIECLRYVACTRARDELIVTYVD